MSAMLSAGGNTSPANFPIGQTSSSMRSLVTSKNKNVFSKISGILGPEVRMGLGGGSYDIQTANKQKRITGGEEHG